jgi:DNA polymerase-3 subunit gamma/tau
MDNQPRQDEAAAGRSHEYVVVARRYRPQAFDELIGQEHVARALCGAIASQRVGHAYLFCGARGVGKTSAARILAKALNCMQGPTPTPCNQCDICRSISTGEDVDVLEIDGASNRGIDEIRQLRQNVNVRPSRARFKIYIIDEVHMLTTQAFNALLKTLEEPPEHVKFIFCTTEPEKIPITILSRCQRFDFAGVKTDSIARRLEQIAAAEGVEAEPEALAILARRAAGSMRDSQSLLEQLLAFGAERITAADVHRMLGTAGSERLLRLFESLLHRDAATALSQFDAALAEGVDAGQLLDQLMGYYRDAMVVAAGGGADLLLHAAPSEHATIVEAGKRLGVSTALASMQLLDHALNRMRYSSHGRVVAEMALARICLLEDLEALPAMIAQLRSGTVLAAQPPARMLTASPEIGAKKKAEPDGVGRLADARPHTEANAAEWCEDDGQVVAEARSAGPTLMPLDATSAWNLWQQALATLADLTADMGAKATRAEARGPNQLAVYFPQAYSYCKTFCEKQSARLEEALQQAAGSPIHLQWVIDEQAPAAEASGAAARPSASPRQRLANAQQHPLVRRAAELFDAVPTRVEAPDERGG